MCASMGITLLPHQKELIESTPLVIGDNPPTADYEIVWDKLRKEVMRMHHEKMRENDVESLRRIYEGVKT